MEMPSIACRTLCDHEATGQSLWSTVHESCFCNSAVNYFQNTGISHWIQTFLIGCVTHLKPQIDRLQTSLSLAEHVSLREVSVVILILPYKVSGVSRRTTGEIEGISGIQSKKHEAACNMSAQDVHRIPHEKKAYYRNKRR
jgi:hypothetical protein